MRGGQAIAVLCALCLGKTVNSMLWWGGGVGSVGGVGRELTCWPSGYANLWFKRLYPCVVAPSTVAL